jgi:hypothetical protein
MKTTLYVKELDDGTETIVNIVNEEDTFESRNKRIRIDDISNRVLQLYKDIEDQNVTPYI